MELTRDITVFFKADGKYNHKVVKAFIINNFNADKAKYGLKENEKALIRIFSVTDYLTDWMINNGDIIVKNVVNEDINNTDAPITYLEEKYGKNNVFKVNSVQENIYGCNIDHIKIGAI